MKKSEQNVDLICTWLENCNTVFKELNIKLRHALWLKYFSYLPAKVSQVEDRIKWGVLLPVFQEVRVDPGLPVAP